MQGERIAAAAAIVREIGLGIQILLMSGWLQTRRDSRRCRYAEGAVDPLAGLLVLADPGERED